MCDRVGGTPEPEPSGALRPEPDTGGGDTSQYSVIDDIGVTQPQQQKSALLPEISFDVYGNLIERDPGVTDQGGVTLSDRDGREPEPGTPGPVSGAGQEESDSDSDTPYVTRSSSSLTPPRHEPFVFDSQRQVYLTSLNQSTQAAYAEIIGGAPAPDGCVNQEEEVTEVMVDVSEANTNQNLDDETNNTNQANKCRKPRGPNKKLLKKQEARDRKEEKKRLYDKAIQAFKNHEFKNYYACAKHFGLNEKSLKTMILERRGFVGGGKHSKILRQEEETKLVAHIRWCQRVGFGLTYSSLRSLIEDLLGAVVR